MVSEPPSRLPASPVFPPPACDYVAAAEAGDIDYCIAEPPSLGHKGRKQGTSCVGSIALSPDNE